MKFRVSSSRIRPKSVKGNARLYLIENNWDDWYMYNTQYDVSYRDEKGKIHQVGQVKVGQFGMVEEQRRANLPDNFGVLGRDFFSLGQDDSYYQNLNKLGPDVRVGVLQGLRDIAFDEELFSRAISEDVTESSLLRFVPRATAEGQFLRLAHGGAPLTRYSFLYALPAEAHEASTPMSFDVIPRSKPSTNIHVLIGRNGVGKTRTLNNMARALVDSGVERDQAGVFNMDVGGEDSGKFVNLVSVTFSAFDPFEPINDSRNESGNIRYSYVGLKRVGEPGDDNQLPKSWQELADEFGESVKVCLNGARKARWQKALKMLEADPIFSDAQVADLADSATDELRLQEHSKFLFENFSSGHKIVLLTITRLVENVEERSLVLLDEPEAHLHPPLLSAFMHSLSDLLVNRNGVAIIATHSPVVLQEVPKSCVWIIRRSGREVVIERPGVETFGENVGTLTREVFGLEVTQSGFHRVLGLAVNEGAEYEEIISRFGGQLGGEARGLVRALLVAREEEEG